MSANIIIPTAVAMVDPDDAMNSSALGPEMVEVTAPTDLPAGYTFVVQSGGRRFPVRVPEGGARAGMKITARAQGASTQDGTGHTQLPSKAPVGRWKDGLCDCICYLFNPVFWVPYCFHLVALGQIMTRLQLGWNGRPGTADTVRNTFKIMLSLTIFFIVSSWMGIMFKGHYYYEEEMAYDQNFQPVIVEDKKWEPSLFFVEYHKIVAIAIYVFCGIMMMRTRYYLRSRYHIPKTVGFLQNCTGFDHICGNRAECEDCVCSFVCQCCTASQMLRHTADYDTYKATCCTATGLPSHVPIDPFIIEEEEENSLQLNVV